MNKIINNPLIGGDIELFLQDKFTKEIVSAEGLIQGTKYEPFVFEEPFFAISLDNVLAEFCYAPAKTCKEFVANITKSRRYIESIIPAHLCTAAIPAARLDEKWLQTTNSRLFGCDPDYNAWIPGHENERPVPNGNLRSAGGHIHVGYDNPHWSISVNLVKVMDLFIGVPSVLQEPMNERKKLYGRAGSFRFKDYGVEFRSVSNYYLQSQQLTEWVFGATERSINFINDGRIDELEYVADLIQFCINANDKITAQNLINQFEIELV